MKKKNIIIIIITVLSLVVIGTVIVKENKEHQPGVVYCLENARAYSDEGLYYFNGAKYLMFLDNTTGQSVPVCAKAECKHNNTECDAFYGTNSSREYILLYDDEIFISRDLEEYTAGNTGVDGDEIVHFVGMIERMNKDGSKRRVIYREDGGAMYSMLAVDGRLYFTTFNRQSEDSGITEYKMRNNYLYSYDMDWGTTKKVLAFPGSETEYSGALYLLDSMDTKAVHLDYSYLGGTEEDSKMTTRLLTVNRKGDIIEDKPMDGTAKLKKGNKLYIQIKVNHNSGNMYYSEGNAYTDKEYVLYRIDGDGNREKLLDEGIRFENQIGGGELCYFIIDERNKVLLDFEENQNYISRSAVSDAHIVPDIFLVDKKNDIVYYDLTDYTGVEDGAIFTEWPCQEACMKWSEFLETYFVPYEGHELEEIHICGSGENGN